MTNALTTPDLEAVYDALAEAIDRAGPERAERMLTKLALLLAHALGDRAAVLAQLDAAQQDL